MAQDEKSLNAFIESTYELFKPVPNARMGETGYEVHFQELKMLSAGLKQSTENEYLSLAGQKPENRKKNRYKDITPFDSTRVKLTVTRDDDPNSDYINASFIKGAENHRNYIASQGPLPHTVLDFWQMLWQYNVRVIIMVCREIELGKKKCERYWAQSGETKPFGNIKVSLESIEELRDGYTLRVIKADNGKETRFIKQFHYTSWPDHGVPKTCFEIISLINHVRDVQAYSEDPNTPLCVHCSAGCGRTGAVLVVDYVRNLLDKRTVPGDLKTFDIISKMRRQRPAIVQTKDQYEFVNTAISELFRIFLRTKTIKYEEFNAAYEGDEYVNVNLSADNKGKERNGIQRQTALQYENVELRGRTGDGTNISSKAAALEFEYPSDPPPPKPGRGHVIAHRSSSGSPADGSYANYDRKQSAPVISTLQKPPVAARSRSSAVSNPPKSPAIIVRTPPTTPTDGNKRLPGAKAALKPTVAPKNAMISPPVQHSGNPVCPSSPGLLHGTSAPSLSFSLTQSKNNNNSNEIKDKKPHAPQPPKKPNLTKAPNTPHMKSPVHEKVMAIDLREKPTPPSRPNKKSSDDALKIREENDVTSESDAESPLSKQNFEKINPHPPPTTKPRPKVGPKPSVRMKPRELQGFSDQNKKVGTETGLLRKNIKPKQAARPLSQNILLSPDSHGMKTGMSASVHDLTLESKKNPPPVAPKTAIVRSASICSMNNAGNEEKQSLAKKRENGRNATRPDEAKIGIRVNRSNNDVKVSTKTAESGSFIFLTSVRKPRASSDAHDKKSKSNPVQHNGNNEKFKTAAANPSYGLVDSVGKQYGPGEGSQQTKKHGTASAQEYVNTEFRPRSASSNAAPHYENHVPQSNESTSKDSRSYANAPPLAPSQSRKPKLKGTSSNNSNNEVQGLHGSVQTTSDQGHAVLASGFSFTEDTKKPPPPKPRRSIMQNQERSHSEDSSSSPVRTSFQPYDREHEYSELMLRNTNDTSKNAVAESEYEEFDESNSISNSPARNNMPSSSGPPKLPNRTPESRMFLSETPPALPERTADSYHTIEAHNEMLTYETVDTSSLSSNSVEPSEATRRSSSSTNTTPAMKDFASKAKNMFDKTTTALSKVGASIAKTGDDDNTGSPAADIENRKASYTAEPVVYNGQEMTFKKRLFRKVKGPRKPK